MQVEEMLAAVEQMSDRGYLSKTEKIVFRQCWEGRSYSEIAQTSAYDLGYIKDTGYRLWQRLSEAYGERSHQEEFQRRSTAGDGARSSSVNR